MIKPKRPPGCIVRHEPNMTTLTCKFCHSDMKRRFPIFGKLLGCINEECDNWFGHYKNRFKQKINITYEK